MQKKAMSEPPLRPDDTDVGQTTWEIVNVLIPPDIAARDEKIRAVASRYVASAEIRDLVVRCIPLRHEGEGYEAWVLRLFIESSQDMVRIRSLIYDDILSTCDFSELFGRTLTAGVEQCPFWNSYETAPTIDIGSIKAGSE